MPSTIGRRIEAAGLANTAAGSVSEGMKVVILTIVLRLLQTECNLQCCLSRKHCTESVV